MEQKNVYNNKKKTQKSFYDDVTEKFYKKKLIKKS